METISISKLKTHLSAELKRVEHGIELTVLDHKRPVAKLTPLKQDGIFVREPVCRYVYENLAPLITTDPLYHLDQERGESW